jgi:hypothetical protein
MRFIHGKENRIMKILPIIFVLLTISTASAQFNENSTTVNHCANDNTLQHIFITQLNVTETNSTRTLTAVTYENCPFGCSSNECRQPPWVVIIGVIAFIIFALIIYLIFRPSGG